MLLSSNSIEKMVNIIIGTAGVSNPLIKKDVDNLFYSCGEKDRIKYYDVFFENYPEIKNNTLYSTRSYKLQVLLMQVEEIKIVDVVKENYKGKMSSKLEFEFTDGKAVNRIVEDYNKSLGVETDRELFSKLRERRKQLLDEYFARQKGDRDE